VALGPVESGAVPEIIAPRLPTFTGGMDRELSPDMKHWSKATLMLNKRLGNERRPPRFKKLAFLAKTSATEG
jgi:hypothetical protein